MAWFQKQTSVVNHLTKFQVERRKSRGEMFTFDVHMTGYVQAHQKLPLSQNHPNPLNPKTSIEYELIPGGVLNTQYL